MLQREDFIARFAGKGYTKHDSAIILNDFLLTMRELLASGESVMFRGFGTFDVRENKERSGVCFDTMKPVVVPAHKGVHFSPGKVLKREVKEGIVRE